MSEKKAAKNNIGAYIKKALGDTMLTYTRRQSGKLGPFSPVLKVLKNNCIYKELIFYGALEYWTKKSPEQLSEKAFQYWWPECLAFYNKAGDAVKNKVYLQLFNSLFV